MTRREYPLRADGEDGGEYPKPLRPPQNAGIPTGHQAPPPTTLAMTTAPPTRAPPLSEGCGLVHSCPTEGMWEAGDPTTTTTGLDDYAATTTVKMR